MHSGSHSSFRDCFPRRKKYSATLHLSIDSHAFIHLTFSRPGALWGPRTLFCCQSPWNMASNEIPSKTDLQHEREITPTPSQWLTARHPPIIPFCAHQRHSQTGDCTKKILTSGIQNEGMKRQDLVYHHHHHQPQTGENKNPPVSNFSGRRDAAVKLFSQCFGGFFGGEGFKRSMMVLLQSDINTSEFSGMKSVRMKWNKKFEIRAQSVQISQQKDYKQEVMAQKCSCLQTTKHCFNMSCLEHHVSHIESILDWSYPE